MNRVTFPLLLMCLAATAACAQPIHRCGSAYAHVPCAAAQVIDAADRRSPEQLAQARRVAADERSLAQRMRDDRINDPSARNASAVSLGGSAVPSAGKPAAKTAAKRPHAKKRNPASAAPGGDFIALDRSRQKGPSRQ